MNLTQEDIWPGMFQSVGTFEGWDTKKNSLGRVLQGWCHCLSPLQEEDVIARTRPHAFQGPQNPGHKSTLRGSLLTTPW